MCCRSSMSSRCLTPLNCVPQVKKTVEAENPVSQPLCGWTYKNVNPIFYNPDGVEMTPEELLEQQRKERK